MRVLVFAHTPPPHHGQSVMVQLMIDGFGGDCRSRRSEGGSQKSGSTRPSSSRLSTPQIYHINARVSDDIADVGGIRLGKLLRLLGYCVEAIWCRIRYGVDTLYYVPAPAKRSAILRDWFVMLLVRPWFRRTVFHWHAFGLGHWATGTTEFPAGSDTNALEPPLIFGQFENFARWLTRFLLRRADLSIVLTEYNRHDAELLNPRHVEIVPNGIPDPCPDFEENVLPERQRRFNARRAVHGNRVERGCARAAMPHDPEEPESNAPNSSNVSVSESQRFSVLFLGHCSHEKGLFQALNAVALSNAKLAQQNSPITINLTVAGSFVDTLELQEFNNRVAQPDLLTPVTANAKNRTSTVSYVGFVSGENKKQLMSKSDCLIFPTSYKGETFGLTVVEALAFGMPAIFTAWRGMPSLAPENYSLITAVTDTDDLTKAVQNAMCFGQFRELRNHFLSHYALAGFQQSVAGKLVNGMV